MQIQKIAKTVNLAIDEALKDLDVTIDKIEYEVLQEPSRGFLGIGSKPAKVLIKLKEEENKKQKSSVEKPEIKKDTKTQPVLEKKIISDTEKKIPRMVTEEETEKDSRDLKDINTKAPEIAKQFLGEIFKTIGISVEVEANLNEKNNLSIELKGENIGIIIGKRGQTLDSLQYLVNLVVNKGQFAYMSVTLDTEDYRERRRQTLENLAINLAKKCKKIKRSVSLEPMNPYERRIIHAKLQNDNTIKTYSEGDEPFRYVVIAPK